ncbi:MAG: nucleotidyltransferase domain-containing protein [bacterium]
MTEKEITILKEFKDKLSEKIKFYKITLFGSRARGDYNEDSDYDVFIVVDKLTPDVRKYIRSCAWEIEFENEIIINTVIVDEKVLSKMKYDNVNLLKSIEKEGVSL